MTKLRALTMHKNNSRKSSKIKGCRPLQPSYNLTGKLLEFGYYSYAYRWQQGKEKQCINNNYS